MDELNTIYIPLLVSQICTRWRKTALATPRLWSRLFLQLDTTTLPRTTLVREWLDRSGACPLTVYLFWEEAPFLSSHPVLEALMDHSERWQAMFFYLPYAAFKSLSRVRKRLSNLRELSLGTSDEPAGYIAKLDAFSVAPRLTSLECVNCSPLTFKFPWSQLTSIPMMAVSIDDCIDVLLQTSRLEKGGFILIDSFPSVYGRGRAIRHQHDHIRSFTIMTPPLNETVDLRGLFPQLCFPHLEELLICNLHSPFCAEFVSFLSRLRCLRTLHLRKTALFDYQLVEGLKYLPTLTSLIVYSAPTQAPTVTHHLLASLTWKKGKKGERLLPLLKKLELTIDYNVAEDFIEMVLSRVLVVEGSGNDHPARLEQIRIRPTEDLGDRIYTGLAKIASHGVEVTVEDLAEAHPSVTD
ncbi:hypothetical protein DFP72DRAFT_815036 [Ephemerocybe angulata]|uniref:F-box domain-containing protein n=1 Tax=Ephemerocybe angulata TaxID=980116 RepID=A0A8H6HTS6_9AGAR|nr:hypothetical protein DFP72DRAFT_815036 [Tulosesus angulatus]